MKKQPLRKSNMKEKMLVRRRRESRDKKVELPFAIVVVVVTRVFPA